MKSTKERSAVERALGLVTRVEPGEAPTALLLTLEVFLLLTAYSCIKPVREALILPLPTGAQYKAYMSGGIAAGLLFAVPAYERVASGLARNRLVIGVTIFFASNLIVFYLLGSTLGPSKPLALAFYVWIGIFNMMVVAQFWAFANDIYSEQAGHRLFPLIGLGASLGAVAGSAMAEALIPTLGTLSMLLVAVGLLIPSAVITQWVHLREDGHERVEPVSLARTEQPGSGGRMEAFRLVIRNRYVTLIAVFSVVFTLVNTNGEYILASLVESTAKDAVRAGTLEPERLHDFIGAFYAQFLLHVDILSLFMQAFLVSRLVRYLGLGVAFYLLPAVALFDASLIAVWPLLSIVKIGKVAENATDYSVNNTVRNMLWLRTTRPTKYLAKQTVDTLFVRMGDVLSAVAVFVGARALGLSVRAFAVLDIVLIAVWLWLARAILHQRAKLPVAVNRRSLSLTGPSATHLQA